MPVIELTEDKLLLQRIAEGEETAFRQLFDRYRGKIYAFVNDFVHDHDNAQEIVQDTFLAVWVNKERLNNVNNPRNYLYTMARNRAYDHIARIARDEKLRLHLWETISLGQNTTDDDLYARESASLVRLALEQLSLQKQEVYSMSRDKGLTHEEIALATGLSKSRVKNILVEVLKHIRAFLEQHAAVALLVSAWMYL